MLCIIVCYQYTVFLCVHVCVHMHTHACTVVDVAAAIYFRQ